VTPPARDVAPPGQWRTVGELVAIGAQRSRLVLVNEAHHGLLRSVRTRRVGLEILAAAHDAGIRHLAMEALHARDAEHANNTRTRPDDRKGYLAQPEMRMLIADALARAWTLIAYEADFDHKPPGMQPRSDEETDWREREQAQHLADALATLPADAGMVVWCGNHHLAKHATPDWRPMATHLPELCGIDAFSIDQTPSVQFPGDRVPVGEPWVSAYAAELTSRGGSAGFLADEAPADWPWRDLAEAFVLSVDNAMT
jgi:hypothetical protein